MIVFWMDICKEDFDITPIFKEIPRKHIADVKLAVQWFGWVLYKLQLGPVLKYYSIYLVLNEAYSSEVICGW